MIKEDKKHKTSLKHKIGGSFMTKHKSGYDIQKNM